MTNVRAHARSGTRGVRRHARVTIRDSPLHGRGAFAVEDIPRGAIIADLTDPYDTVFNWGVSPKWSTQAREAFIAHMNSLENARLHFHPDTPRSNVLTPMRARNAHTWIAARDIRSGEELLI